MIQESRPEVSHDLIAQLATITATLGVIATALTNLVNAVDMLREQMASMDR